MNQITVVDGASGIQPLAKRNKWKVLDELIEEADRIVEYFGELLEQLRDLHRFERGQSAADEIPDMSEPDAEIGGVQECKSAIAVLDPQDAFDDDGCIKKAIVSKRLATMIGAYPAGAPANPEVYSRMLLEHIASDNEIGCIVLECSCREVERKHKFIPSISEVLEIIEEQKDIWEIRRNAINQIERRAQNVIETIAKLKPKVDKRVFERAVGDASMKLLEAQNIHSATMKRITIRQQEAARLAESIASDFERLAKEAAVIKAMQRSLKIAAKDLADYHQGQDGEALKNFFNDA
jgi:hypothetical protein